jgi:hypothetical protein
MSLHGFAQRLPARRRQRAGWQDHTKNRIVSRWPVLGEESLRQQSTTRQPDPSRVLRRDLPPLWPYDDRPGTQLFLDDPGDSRCVLCLNTGPAEIRQDQLARPSHLNNNRRHLAQPLNSRSSQTPQDPRVTLQCPLPHDAAAPGDRACLMLVSGKHTACLGLGEPIPCRRRHMANSSAADNLDCKPMPDGASACLDRPDECCRSAALAARPRSSTASCFGSVSDTSTSPAHTGR